MFTKPAEMAKHLRDIVKQDGVTYHIRVQQTLPPGFVVSRNKEKAEKGELIGTITYQAQHNLLMVGGNQIKLPTVKQLNIALQKGSSKMTFAIGAAPAESAYDAPQAKAIMPDAQGQFPPGSPEDKVLKELQKLFGQNASLPSPLPKEEFDKVHQLFAPRPPETVKAVKAIKLLKQKMALQLKAHDKREEQLDQKEEAEQKKQALASAERKRASLVKDWLEIRKDFKALILNIQEHLGKDAKELAKDAATIPELLKGDAASVQKALVSITYYQNMKLALETKNVDWSVEPAGAPLT